jgi:hypothetical protein
MLRAFLKDASRTLTESVATEIAATYTDQPVFPFQVRIIAGGSDQSDFAGWPTDVLVLAVENQGVCTWGVDLGEDHFGRVLVGGDLSSGPAVVEYCSNIEEYIASRRWDAVCLNAALLQAQAEPIDDRTLGALRAAWQEQWITFGWPGMRNRRFQQGRVRLMLWDGEGQCDWWVSGPVDDLRRVLPALRGMSNLRSALWSNDESGVALLAEH